MVGQREPLGTILLVLLAFNHATAVATVGFKPAVNYPVATKPVAAAAGDFDGDGKIDLAVVNSGDATVGDAGSVSILLGNGDGTFQAAVNIPAGKNPVSIAAADFNGDNRPDLVVVNFDGGVGNIGILLGNGNGTFQSPVDYAVASGPTMVVVGDFNGDRKMDLAVSASNISVLLGNGDGTFQSHVDCPFGGRMVAVADFNGDGKEDLAVASLGVGVALGNGDGTFQPPIAHGGFLTGMTVGDFNRDGKVDVFATFHGLDGPSNGVFIAGNGDGTFQGGGTAFQLTNPGNVFQADFNGDAKLDLVTTPGNLGGSEALAWIGNGDGTFQSSAITLTFGSSPNRVITADLNGDKSPDIIATNFGDNTISILLNTIGTDFSMSASAASPSTVSPGQSATSTVSLSLLNAFDNPVSLACSVQPVQAGSPMCSLNPATVAFDANGKASAQLAIGAGPALALLTPPKNGSAERLFSWPVVLGFAALGAGLRRDVSKKRRVLGLLATCCLFAGLIVQSACGGSSGSKAQTYTVTVTGASGNTKHSTTVTLTVQ